MVQVESPLHGGECLLGAFAGGDCYALSVSSPGTRPAQHWDAGFTETVNGTAAKAWTIHIGESFPDVPSSDPFYAKVETLFHTGVTAGCSGGNYWSAASITRAQMAVFLLKGKVGSAYAPPRNPTPTRSKCCSTTVTLSRRGRRPARPDADGTFG